MLILFGIVLVIAFSIFENIFIFAHTSDQDEKDPFEIMGIAPVIESSGQRALECRSLPSLIIIGPPKTGTTSLMVNLAAYFPNWHRQNIKENGHWYSSLRLKVIRNSSRFVHIERLWNNQIEQIENGKGIKISNYKFDEWLTEQIWPHSEIMDTKISFIGSLLNRTQPANFKITNNRTFLIEKTALYNELSLQNMNVKQYPSLIDVD